MMLDFRNVMEKKGIIKLLFILMLCSVKNSYANPLQSKKCRIAGSSPLISLSGPVTHFLYNLGLLNDPLLKAISTYHGFDQTEFKGKIVGGGLFLSSKVLAPYNNPIIFYDDSRELQKNLEQMSDGKKVAIVTRGLDPFSVYKSIKEQLNFFIVDCESQLKELDSKIYQIEKQLKKSAQYNHRFLFYLGEIREGHRRPNYMMIHDGPVQWWIKENKFESYPTSLAYSVWSEKIVDKLKKEEGLIEIGLNGEKHIPKQDRYELIVKTLSPKNIEVNFYFPSVLIPGIPQIFFMKEFFSVAENFNWSKASGTL